MNDYAKMWQTALIEIETAVSQANFSTWFKETRIIREDGGTVYLEYRILSLKNGCTRNFTTPF